MGKRKRKRIASTTARDILFDFGFDLDDFNFAFPDVEFDFGFDNLETVDLWNFDGVDFGLFGLLP